MRWLHITVIVLFVAAMIVFAVQNRASALTDIASGSSASARRSRFWRPSSTSSAR